MANANEVLFTAAAQDVHASGNTPDIVLNQSSSVAVDINLGAFTGGASPSVTFTLQRKDALGNYNPVKAGTALTAAGYQSLDCGPGLPGNGVILHIIRLAWVTAGGPTAVSAAISIVGA